MIETVRSFLARELGRRNFFDMLVFISLGLIPFCMVPVSRSPSFFVFCAAVIAFGLAIWRKSVPQPWRRQTAVSPDADIPDDRRVVGKGGGEYWLASVHGTAWLFLVLALWMAISLLWTFEPVDAALNLAKILLAYYISTILFSHFHSVESRFALGFYLVWLVIAFSVAIPDLLNITRFHSMLDSNALPFDLNRLAVFLVVSLWPMLLMISFSSPARLVAAVAYFAVVILTVSLSHSQTAQVVLVFSALSFAFVAPFKWCRRAAGAAMVFMLLTAPLLLLPLLERGDGLPKHIVQQGHLAHRTAILHGYMDRIFDRPIVGWGMNAHEHLGKHSMLGDYAKKAGFPAQAVHPHNFIVEIWVNLGLIGVVLSAMFLSSMLALIERMPDPARIAAFQVVFCAYFISFVGHAMTQSWWLAVLAATTALVGAMSAQPDPAPGKGLPFFPTLT